MSFVLKLFLIAISVLLISNCWLRYRSDVGTIDKSKISNAELSNQNIGKQRLCYQELDNCFSKCSERFPVTQRPNYIPRGNCRDSCVNTIRETTDCVIYYQSSRK
ncbi:hypothetical protein EHO98_12275 [Leptospira stimsonii]|uniref:Cys-rich protein n=1 Tax=Leptospira stimsonii TaxID=2202203 RepID=A0ABY2MZM2_9LEPT|nr:hypothetical protein EHO98_12275 [Leptospira stimsonii]TGM12905.1 hypothetical protein EHQ90_14720 [Leptospira stimsonii]